MGFARIQMKVAIANGNGRIWYSPNPTIFTGIIDKLDWTMSSVAFMLSMPGSPTKLCKKADNAQRTSVLSSIIYLDFQHLDMYVPPDSKDLCIDLD